MKLGCGQPFRLNWPYRSLQLRFGLELGLIVKFFSITNFRIGKVNNLDFINTLTNLEYNYQLGLIY